MKRETLWAKFWFGLLIMTVTGVSIFAVDYFNAVRAYRDAVEGLPEAQCGDEANPCDQRDLPAQVRAAASSEAIVDLTFAQLLLSAIGLLFLGWTLRHTAAQADAANATNELAQKQLIATNRPWVQIIEIAPSEMGLRRVTSLTGNTSFLLRADIRLKNVGSAPAEDVRINFRLKMGNQTQDALHWSAVVDARTKGSGSECIFPGEEIVRPAFFEVRLGEVLASGLSEPTGLLERVMYRGRTAFATVVVTYRTPLDGFVLHHTAQTRALYPDFYPVLDAETRIAVLDNGAYQTAD